MADYGKLLSRIWSDPDFVALEAHPQQLYCLLISYPTRNVAGVLPMTLKRWAGSTRGATVETVTLALKALAEARFVVIDWDSEELLIRTYIRNDEVYRQPNLMKSAWKFALQIESPTLRWALHDELIRLPHHRDVTETDQVAKQLAETLPKPIVEPLPEPFTEPPGVGVSYVSGEREHQHLHPKPSPAAAPRPIGRSAGRTPTFTEMAGGTEPPAPPPDPGEHVVTARALVKQVIPSSHPVDERGKLAHYAGRLLESGTNPELVKASLQLWLTKPHAGPGLLPSLVSEVIKTRTNGPSPPASARPNKVRGFAELAAEERTNELRNSIKPKEIEQ